MSKRLIYAEDVIKEIDEWLDIVGAVVVGKNLSYYGELLGCIEDAPTVDAVEVVRCKDCDMLQKCKISQYLGLDGYCSNADMRKNGE